jgi:hypothetical protein
MPGAVNCPALPLLRGGTFGPGVVNAPESTMAGRVIDPHRDCVLETA